jgi:iron complex outermembrane receptor protein
MCVAAFSVCTFSIKAQVELDPVTVSATLHPVSSSVTGRNIIVIKGEDFSKLPVNSIDELLRYLPGLEVQMRGPMGAQSDLVLRGGTFQQVLVVLDGIRLNDPITGHFSSYIPIAPAEIERIEVLKGASSAIYGSEAVGGVIHIITKTFAAKRNQDSKQLTAQGTVGEYGLVNGQIGAFCANGKTALSAGLISNNASGQPLRGIKGYFYNTTASVSVNHFINNNWNIALRSAYDTRDFAAQNFYTPFASDTAIEKVTSLWNHVKLAYNNEKHSFSLDAGYKTVKDEFLFNNRSIANNNKSNLLQGLAVYKLQSSSKTSFTTGANWLNKQIRSNDRGNHSLDQVGVFAMLNQTIGSSFHINPAMRVQWSERSGWEVIPQLNLSYKIPDWKLRASAGKTTRDADFTERFNNYNKPLVTGGSIGNPDLQAEHSFSYEAGADFFGISNMKISGTFFQRYFSNLIDFVTTPYAQMPRRDNLSPTGTFALAKNIAELTSTGFETDIQYSKKLSNDQQLWITSGLTWIDTKGATANSFYINSHAKFLTNFNVQYSVKWFSISTNGLYKTRHQRAATAINASIEKDYFVLNLQLQGFIYKRKLSLFTQVDNLFDTQYSDLLGSKMPGRWLMGGFKARL